VAAITALNEDIGRVEGELDVEREKLKAQKQKLAQVTNETSRVEEDTKTNTARLGELKAELADFPEGVKPETLQEDLNRIKQTISELKANAEAKEGEVQAEMAKVANLERAVAGLAKKQDDRKKAFERNSMKATIVAVNSDWGFVVINAGQPEGFTESTKLIVTRGVHTICKLSIISVQGSRTIANIIGDTMTPGMSIAPGDQVILENLYQ
jgi:chromosome condensin MukBEF ATPase and DNA-binding subunit MukB